MKSTTLVTGASTGIGLEIVKKLAVNNFVYAGVRKREDAERVEKISSSVRAVILDVTKPEQIQEAYTRISNEADPLLPFHLINNAGIAVSAPIEGVSIDAIREQFEVNVFGLVSACQIFSPLLRKNRGKIVMIGSVSGLVSAPFLGVYSASKFALEAITTSLRMEVAPFGVSVYMIRPGQIETPIWEKNFAKAGDVINSLPADVRSRYEKYLKTFVKIVKADVQKAIPASHVADAVADCLESRWARTTRIVASPITRFEIMAAVRLPLKIREKILSKKYGLDGSHGTNVV